MSPMLFLTYDLSTLKYPIRLENNRIASSKHLVLSWYLPACCSRKAVTLIDRRINDDRKPTCGLTLVRGNPLDQLGRVRAFGLHPFWPGVALPTRAPTPPISVAKVGLSSLFATQTSATKIWLCCPLNDRQLRCGAGCVISRECREEPSKVSAKLQEA